jgi:16S rRNA (cytosine967-C5)-methyltransferase
VTASNAGKASGASNVRGVAASILVQLLEQKGSLTSGLQPFKSRDDYPLLQEMCFGTCRHFYSLEFVLKQLVAKPLRSKDKDVKCLLLIGLYQLRHMSLPEYAVINETVSGVSKLKKPWSRGLINAVLRNYLRDLESVELKINSSPAYIKYDQPKWLADQIQQDWPDHWQQIFESSNQRPPMTVRVNLSRVTRSDYLEQLESVEIDAASGNLASSSIYLTKPQPVELLPGFSAGLSSIQDESSQLIPPLLQLEPHQRVLDACAAPGGKTCHILETQPRLDSLTSLDIAKSRLVRVEENLQRLSLKANLKAADARDLAAWWDGKLFDRILLDAPCSATGVIRRHPDIKVLRSPENVAELNTLQLAILQKVWSTLKPGGLLLYTTCSILPQENSEIVAKFIESSDNAKYEGINADWGVECPLGRQLLPSDNGPDGFFFSLIRKAS